MNTKEAIEKIKRLNEIICEETISDIVFALEYGEKYEQMWEELYNKYNGKVVNAIIDMRELEQKYFPKGEGEHFFEATSKDPHLRKVYINKKGGKK